MYKGEIDPEYRRSLNVWCDYHGRFASIKVLIKINCVLCVITSKSSCTTQNIRLRRQPSGKKTRIDSDARTFCRDFGDWIFVSFSSSCLVPLFVWSGIVIFNATATESVCACRENTSAQHVYYVLFRGGTKSETDTTGQKENDSRRQKTIFTFVKSLSKTTRWRTPHRCEAKEN